MGPPLIKIILSNQDDDVYGIFDRNGSGAVGQPREFVLSVECDYNPRTCGLTTSVSPLEYKGVENRVTTNHGGPANFIHVSFQRLSQAGFAHKQFNAEKKIEEILTSGITVQHHDEIRTFIFCGHSNSQLKSRSCFFYKAESANDITGILTGFGNFAQIKTVEKYVKRIGLLFSKSTVDTQLQPEMTLDIPDVERNGHIFTDGCGLISLSFAETLTALIEEEKNDLPKNYIPSVFQIRYKGYKGILMVVSNEFIHKQAMANQSLISKIWRSIGGTDTAVLFRNSMKKFEGCPDNTFAVLDYSKPSFAGALNSEIVNLLSSNGIPNDVLVKKQGRYLNYIRSVDYDNRESVVQFLKLVRRYDLVAKLEAVEDKHYIPKWIKGNVQEMKRQELSKSLDVSGMARVHIQIPNSRLLLGVCDVSGKLLEGQCYIRILSTDLTHSIPISGQVIVTRNPCLFPGDIQHFVAQSNIPELAHLSDCIVFSTQGKMPAASTLSGGDLDGDKFYVSWDPDLIKMEPKGALDYSLLAPRTTVVPSITWEMRVTYFAHYATSLGKIMSLYWKWTNARPTLRANSSECKQLSKLYARCVDGEKVQIPKELRNPPPSTNEADILKVLKQNIKDIVLGTGRNFHDFLNATDIIPESLLHGDIQGDELFLQDPAEPKSKWRLINRSLTSIRQFIFPLGVWMMLLSITFTMLSCYWNSETARKFGGSILLDVGDKIAQVWLTRVGGTTIGGWVILSVVGCIFIYGLAIHVTKWLKEAVRALETKILGRHWRRGWIGKTFRFMKRLLVQIFGGRRNLARYTNAQVGQRFYNSASVYDDLNDFINKYQLLPISVIFVLLSYLFG